MFDVLLNLVKENATDVIFNNPDIPQDKKEAVCETTTNSIVDKLKETALSGGLDSITNLFKGGNNAESQSLVSNLSSGVAGDLMKKFGLDGAVTRNIVQQLIPLVMGKLGNKINDPNDSSVDMTSIIGLLTSSQGGNILNKLKGFF